MGDMEDEEEMEEEEGNSNSYSPVPSLIASLKREDSSSPDSGIQEDSEPEFPDWTQLSSTLDLRSGSELGEQRAAPRKVTLPKTPLAPGAFKLQFVEKVTKSKPVTLTSRSSPSTITPPSLPTAPLLLHCKTAALLSPCSKEEELVEEEDE